MRLRIALVGGALVAGLAVPVPAQNVASDEAALVRKLRDCLTAGAPGAPRDSLTSAVVALRSLCYTQIRRVRDVRLRAIDERFGLPEASLTQREHEELERARDLATRHLNDEIAVAVANFTGLTF